MLFAVKLSDVVSDRGVVTGPLCHLNVRINGIPMATEGTQIAPHLCCGAEGCDIHCVSFFPLGTTAPRILVNGIPIIVSMTDLAICGEPTNRQAIPSAVYVQPL